ncbi:MAG: glycosyltransferase family protein, partial [Dehalococcoidia bacterium]
FKLAEKINKKGPRKDDGIVRIGYFSGTLTHQRDFQEAEDALCRILEKYRNVEFHAVGEINLPDCFSRYPGRVIRTARMPHLEMLKYMARMDINIAPLDIQSPFAASKSEIKIFEPALLNVPTVASAVDSYARCIADGRNGMLVSSREEWFDKLSLLIEDKELRLSLGKNAREDFINRYYIDEAIDCIINTYEEFIDLYRSGKTGAVPLEE